MRWWCLLGFMTSILVAEDESRTWVSMITNETEVTWEVASRCDVISHGGGGAQAYFAGAAGEWQPILDVVRRSRGVFANPFGLKGIMIKDPYLSGCQIRLRPICKGKNANEQTKPATFPTYYIRHGKKVSGYCPSARSFGPFLLEVNINKDFEESEEDAQCRPDVKVARYCGDEEAFINLVIRKDGTLDFQQGPNATLIDLKEESPYRIRPLSTQERLREHATWPGTNVGG